MYIAFNKGTPDALLNKWQTTYETLHKEGHIEKIFSKYGLDTLYPKILADQK